jgi:hypothetical protein
MSSQVTDPTDTTDKEQQTTPRDQTITGVEKVTPSRFMKQAADGGIRTVGQQSHGKAPTTEKAAAKAAALKADKKRATSPKVFYPPGSNTGGKKTKRKKKHLRRTKKGGHCGKNINKINRLLKALKKEMKILERKQKSYYTKSKKLKKGANKKHIKSFKKLKLKLNKI